AAGRDPKDFLLEVIGPARQVSPEMLGDTWNHGESPERYPVDTGRLRRVVEVVAREAGWGRKLPKGHGLGIAAHYSFVSYIAAVGEGAVGDKGAVTIPRVDMAGGRGGAGQPRPRAGPDGGRVRDGRRHRDAGRDQLQERPRGAGQLQLLRGDPHARGAASDPGAHRARRLQQADGWRGGAGRAADPARALQ